MSKNYLIPIKRIESKIFLIRGKKVMLDRDLAELYEVSTKRLNEQVKRNIKRFPEDFMFQLKKAERDELVANCDRLERLKHSSSFPYAFTEQGVAMLSSVLNSERAILVNIQIMRTFVKLKELMMTHVEFAKRLDELERKFGEHDKDIKIIFEAIKQLLEPPAKPKRQIGFHSE